MQGQTTEGLAQMYKGVADWRSIGARVELPWFLTSLAAAYGEAGQVDAGLQALDDARRIMDDTDERWCEAELYRLQGVLLLQRSEPDADAAEEAFRHALDIARAQQTKSWELRVAISLSHLWQQQGKDDAARHLLSHTYGWFTEGFDTADLQAAKTLLQVLG
jgi:predicted ATPase